MAGGDASARTIEKRVGDFLECHSQRVQSLQSSAYRLSHGRLWAAHLGTGLLTCAGRKTARGYRIESDAWTVPAIC